MRWNVLIYDPKIIILLIILVIFLVISIIIVYYEMKLKKRSKIRFTQNVEETRIDILKKGLRKSNSPTDKLTVIDRQAKSLFKERFNMSTKKSYSELKTEFTRKKLYQYSKFCEKMFESYYTKTGVTEQNIKDLLEMLTKLIREQTTYLDPENYSVDNLLESSKKDIKIEKLSAPPKIVYKQSKDEKKVEKKRRFLQKKERSVITKEQMLTKRKRLLEQREKEIAKKEQQNKRIIFEIEKKLNEQERKIKREEEIQRRIAREINKTAKKVPEIKKIEEKVHKEKEIVNIPKKVPHKTSKATSHEKEELKEWRSSIETKPVRGKDWLKERKKRGSKN